MGTGLHWFVDSPGFCGRSTAICSTLTPPDHTRLRAFVHRRSRHASSSGYASRFRRWRRGLLDTAMRAMLGTLDLVEAYALPLPSIVIADLLGVPAG